MPRQPASPPTTRAAAAGLTSATLLLALASLSIYLPEAAAQPPGAAVLPAAGAASTPFETAVVRFRHTAAGQSDAIDDAVRRFDALLAQDPADPVLRAYAGAAQAMRATTTLLPWRKLGHAEDGLAQIDKALAMLGSGTPASGHRGVPSALETRFVAANTFLAVPSFMNRGERGRRLLEEILTSPQFETSPLDFRAAVWLRAGTLAVHDKREADARRWFDKVVASDAPQAASARSALKGL